MNKPTRFISLQTQVHEQLDSAADNGFDMSSKPVDEIEIDLLTFGWFDTEEICVGDLIPHIESWLTLQGV